MRRRVRRAVAALLLLPLVGSFTASPRFVGRGVRRSSLILASAFTPDVDENGENAEAGIIIKSSPGKGFGAFATRTIQEETEVGEYVGEIVTSKQVATRYEAEKAKGMAALRSQLFAWKRELSEDTATGDYLFKVDDDVIIDGEKKETANWTRYLNHAADPNLRVKSLPYAYVNKGPRVWFVANREIQAGEELCFDYGETYWFEDDQVVDADTDELGKTSTTRMGTGDDEVSAGLAAAAEAAEAEVDKQFMN